MRTQLKMLRIQNGLNQKELAEKLNIAHSNYSLIETGKHDGSIKFWTNVQNTLQVPSDKMWDIINEK